MGAAAAIILRKERDIVATYRGAGATRPDAARSPGELGIDQRMVHQRLVRRAVLRESGDGRYYLDEPSWEALRGIRHRLALVILVILVVVFIVLIAGGIVSFGAVWPK
jgi:hypothetical protein